MDDNHRVLPRLDDFIEIADRASPRCDGQRAIDPHGVAAANEIAPGEIARGEGVVTRDRDEWSLESPRHVFDEPRFSAACRTFEHHGKAAVVTLRKNLDLVAY